MTATPTPLRELPAKWRNTAGWLDSSMFAGASVKAVAYRKAADELEAALSAVYEGSGCVFCDLNTEHKGNPCTATPPASGEAGADGWGPSYQQPWQAQTNATPPAASGDAKEAEAIAGYIADMPEGDEIDRLDHRYLQEAAALIRRLAAVAPASMVLNEPERKALAGVMADAEHDAGDVDDIAPRIEDDEDAYWAFHRYHGLRKLLAAVAPAGMDDEVAAYLAESDREAYVFHADGFTVTPLVRSTRAQPDSVMPAEVVRQQASLYSPATQVFFRAGLIACREYMARFVQAESPSIAASIRANWWPNLGQDFGPPRKIDWNELTEGEFGTPSFRVKSAGEVSPTLEALPIALGFLELSAAPTPPATAGQE